MGMKIGFIGIIGDQIKADPNGTLKWAADLGFDGIEGATALGNALGITNAQVNALLKEHGMEPAVQGALSRSKSDDENKAIIRTAAEIGSKYSVDYYAPCTDKAQVVDLCDYLNRMGRFCADEGLTFLYHNHNQEFKSFDGQYGMEVILANTDPALVKLELDVGWVTFGGADPVAFLEKHGARCPVLHMKDYDHAPAEDPNGDETRKAAVFAEVGTGILNAKGVVEVARQTGSEWLIIEQDRMNKLGPKESLALSYKNLRALVG